MWGWGKRPSPWCEACLDQSHTVRSCRMGAITVVIFGKYGLSQGYSREIKTSIVVERIQIMRSWVWGLDDQSCHQSVWEAQCVCCWPGAGCGKLSWLLVRYPAFSYGLGRRSQSALWRAEGVGNNPVAACRGTNLTMMAFRRSWHLRFFHLQSLVLFTFVRYKKCNSFLTNLLLYKPPTDLMWSGKKAA